ncbi:MAG: hypothetical protein R3240_08990, partial [Gammaproteobacteria bacterium]|nr:hypothetical protein [Gammaproteobacteria bacterium]
MSIALLLNACGGGSGSDGDPGAQTQPAIQSISVDKASLTLNQNEDVSSDIVVTLQFADETTATKALTINWQSLGQKFQLSGDGAEDFELNYSAEDNKLSITNLASQQSAELDVDITTILDLITQLSLNVEKNTLSVGDNIQANVSTEFTVSDTTDVLPEGISCKLLEGEGVISVSSDCQITALSAGAARVSLDVPMAMLDTSVEIPELEITVEPVAVVATDISLSVSELTVEKGSDSQHNISLVRHFSDDSTVTNNFQVQWLADSSAFTTTASHTLEFSAGVLTITDSQTGFTATINVSISEAPLPQITKLSLTANKNDVFVGDTVNLTVLAEYDNG